MSRDTDFGAAYLRGMEHTLDTVDIGGIEHTLVPKDCSVVSFEKLMPAPARIKAAHKFHDIESFARYFKEFAEDGTRIFVDESKSTFVAVFDCDHKGAPAWGDHSISLSMDIAHEWTRFTNANNQKMDQRVFAEFLEDSVDYIVGPNEFTGARLLEMAQNINMDIKGNFACTETMAEGLKVLNIKDESTAHANINGQNIKFPAQLELALRVFRGSKAYKFNAHLRHRVRKEGLLFWYTIPDIEAVKENAFAHVIAQVQEACGKDVYRGSYGSRY